MDRKTIENAYRIYQKKHGGSIDEISILFVNVTEALSEAAEQSVRQTCSTCGGENGKHELDCRVAHNMLADNASW